MKYADANKLSREDLQEIYNHIPNAKPVKRLRNREYAVERIWDQAPAMKARAEIGTTKSATLISMLEAGTTVEQVQEATGWQRHTVRGAISTLQSKGVIKVETSRQNGVTHYKAVRA